MKTLIWVVTNLWPYVFSMSFFLSSDNNYVCTVRVDDDNMPEDLRQAIEEANRTELSDCFEEAQEQFIALFMAISGKAHNGR